ESRSLADGVSAAASSRCDAMSRALLWKALPTPADGSPILLEHLSESCQSEPEPARGGNFGGGVETPRRAAPQAGGNAPTSAPLHPREA
ncbi:MAG: hypothetical protein ACKO6N_16890, partial [Myxococcota bacterium]